MVRGRRIGTMTIGYQWMLKNSIVRPFADGLMVFHAAGMLQDRVSQENHQGLNGGGDVDEPNEPNWQQAKDTMAGWLFCLGWLNEAVNFF